MDDERALSIDVLGPLAATVAGSPVRLGGPRQRALLAVLVAAEGRPLSVGRLADELWDGDQDLDPAGAIAAYASRLRRVLEPGRPRQGSSALTHGSGGYSLDPAAYGSDARRVERQVTEARALLSSDPLRAQELLATSLGPWRGEPFAGVLAPGVRAARARLVELHQHTRELLAQARLLAGAPDTAVADLEQAHVEQPLREQTLVLLCTALYRSGRQLDAVDRVRRNRALLRDQFGLDAGSRLDRLESDLLARAAWLEDPAGALDEAAGAERASTVVRPPRGISSFVGRSALLDRLDGVPAETRLVTLVGSGGVGKTRLAAEHLGRREDAVWVALAAVHDAALVPGAVSEALGVVHQPGRLPLLGAVEVLRTRAAVLALDNCEHVREAVARVVQELLAQVPGLSVVATSRERLGVPGELVVDVEPLATEEPSGADGAAVELFAARAAAVSGLWSPDEQTWAAVRRLCRDLDGLPLALELAAAQTRVLDPVELAAGLRARRLHLTATGPAATPHHRSLQAAFEWSHGRLSPQERDDLAAVAVFEGPFDLDAAEVLLGRDTGSALAPLVEQSLVRALPGRPRRYELLRTVAAQVRDHTTPASRERFWERHVQWAADLARQCAPRLRSADARRVLALLEGARPDLRAAVRRAVELGKPDVAVSLCADLGWFWYRRGHLAEGIALLGEALQHAPSATDAPRARAALGRLHYLTGNGTDAHDEAVRALHAAADAPEQLVDAGYTAAWMAALTGDVPGALSMLGQAHEHAVQHGDASGEAMCLMVQGQLARVVPGIGDPEEHLDRAVALGAASGDVWVTVSSRWILAKTLLAAGRAAEAIDQLLPAARDAAEDGDGPAVLATSYVLAAALASREPALAAELAAAVDAVARTVGYDVRAMDPEAAWLDPMVSDAVALHPDATARGSSWSHGELVAALSRGGRLHRVVTAA